MRQELANLTRKEFARQMKDRLPQFVEEKHEDVPPGTRVYVWDAAPTLACYITLLFAPMEDRFTLDVSWSLNKRYPSATLHSDPDEAHYNGDKCFRLSRLYGETKDPPWWVAEKPNWQAVIELGIPLEDPPIADCIPKVKPAVEDAVDRIVEYAVPYFQRIVSKYS